MRLSRRHTTPSTRRPTRPTTRHRTAVAAGALSASALVFPLLPGTAGLASAASGPGATVPSLSWSACGDGLQCARAQVPLDHDRPGGAQITLALARRPATDPAHRIGTLFVNNGGPGNSVVDFVRGDAREVVPARVQERFDVVGFDPRGVGRSSPVRCFPSTDAQQAFFADRPAFPVGGETAAFTAGSVELARQCGAHGGPLLSHMSTADVARDLDLLRRAVGDTQLSLAGYSYGGLLGTTYANLYPGRVRALLLDGTPSPAEFTRRGGTADLLPVTLRVRSAPATGRALDAFVAACQAHPTTCSFASADTRGALDALMARLRTGPVVVQTPDGPLPITYAFLVDALRGALTFPPIWPFVADQLTATAQAADPQGVLRAAPTAGAPQGSDTGAFQGSGTGAFQGYDNSREALLAVTCSDSDDPRLPGAWPTFARVADAQTPLFGADWAYVSQPCASWPVQAADRFSGPYTATTAHPALFVHGTQDAASDLAQGRATAAAMPGSRLLVVQGAGHPASFVPDRCLADATSAYLVDGQLPPADAVCRPDSVPFGR